ncbi:MAG: mannonate dehydratase, partial [Prevotella sp.]|nr:mannonate dehydratase [Prevotella sp.]
IEILGLPRIVRTADDIRWMLNAVPNRHNGLTFCAGSLSAGTYNNVLEMAREFAPRTHFVHLRSCHIFPNGDFTEASHLGGRADIVELCRIFENEELRMKNEESAEVSRRLPMRVDHGMTFTDEPGGIMDESSHGHNAGYTLLGRMFALGQVQGILATVDRELGIPYKQPGFFD